MRHVLITLTALLLTLPAASCTAGDPDRPSPTPEPATMSDPTTAVATFGAGCFWCVEAVFDQIDGVLSVTSGYSGGHVPNPTYDQVTSGATGHAEVTQVVYDPTKVSYETLLEVFWTGHDPTTKDRQGADVGPQYRSVIFTHTPEQARLADEYRKKLDASGAFDAPIVTEIVPFTAFYKAEEYHQDYFNQNRYKPYCMFVIAPKVEKIRKAFRDRLKSATD
jgi:peptide-methionine (S)-S-oxide reductase